MANTETRTQVTSATSSSVASSTNVVKPSRMPRKAVPPPFQQNRFLKSIPEKNTQPPSFIKEDHAVDLEKLSLSELKELLKKQNHLAQNKNLLAKLKDKGEKIITLRDKIATKIKLKEEINETEMLFEKLTINSNNVSQFSIQLLFIQFLIFTFSPFAG